MADATARNDRTPATYAAGYLGTLRGRWNGPLGVAVRAAAPVVWPGVPPQAFVGFTAIGGQREDTALPPVGNSFHEIGYFQTEAGPQEGPAPHPDPGAPYNRWGRTASDARVVRILGRTATMAPDAWKDAVADQAAVGLVNLAEYAETVAGGLPAGVAPADPASLWRVALGFTGFSAGAGGARAAVARYGAALAGVPEGRRFAAWVVAILNDARAGTMPGRAGLHGNPAYDALRTWQKLAAGADLARSTGGVVGWFDTGFGLGTAAEAQAQQALTDAAYGRTPGAVHVPSGAAWLALAAGVAAAAGAGYYVYRRGGLEVPAWLRRAR